MPVIAFGAPRLAWVVQTDGPVRGSAVVRDDTTYFGSADGFLYAVNAENGTLRWKADTGGVIAGAPAVGDDIVVAAGRGPEVMAVRRTDGTRVWSFVLGATVPTPTSWNYFTAAPVIDTQCEQVLVPSGDGHLYALELVTGKERWRFKTGDSLRASPLVVEGTVYQPSGDDHVYALDAATGAERWRFATAGVNYDLSQGFIRSDMFTRPSLQDGLLVVGSRDANVYAIDIATQEAAWTFAYDSTWAMSTAVHDGTVFVGWSTNNKVSALDLKTGQLRWDHTLGSHTYTTAAVVDDLVIWGSADGHLRAFDRLSGEPRWDYAVGSEIYGSPVAAAGRIYCGTDDGRLLALIDDDAPPAERAVFLPATIPDNLRAFVIDARLADHLTANGYTRLDSADALAAWIASRREELASEDGARAAVVFAYPLIPDSTIGETPESGPLRAYLEAGGKVVWPWGIPNQVTFNADGSFRVYDPTVAERLLDIDVLGFEDSGNYFARATQTGRNWGLPARTKTTFAFLEPTDTAAVTPLAFDEYGRVGAFVKTFVDRPGTGWVAYLPSGYGVPFTDEQLELLRRVADYGMR